MSAMDLNKALKLLKKCYKGKSKDGEHVLVRQGDKLAFDFALTRVDIAIENKELTDEDFITELEES